MKHTVLRISTGVVLLCTIAPSDAASYFADQGSVQVGGSAAFSTTGQRNQDFRDNVFDFQPIVNFFPLRYFLLGPVCDIRVTGSDGNRRSNFGIGVRAGFAYNNDLPVIPFLYGAPQTLISSFDNRNDSGSDVAFGFEVSGGIMIPVQERFSINIGPSFWMEFNDGWRQNIFSVTMGVTGWIF